MYRFLIVQDERGQSGNSGIICLSMSSIKKLAIPIAECGVRNSEYKTLSKEAKHRANRIVLLLKNPYSSYY